VAPIPAPLRIVGVAGRDKTEDASPPGSDDDSQVSTGISLPYHAVTTLLRPRDERVAVDDLLDFLDSDRVDGDMVRAIWLDDKLEYFHLAASLFASIVRHGSF
jgi:hypothetical protein